MKAFVIKNKEGKYDGWDSWEEDIRYAFNYPSEEGAECAIRQLGFEDCTIVPITIYEGDLEKALRLACETIKELVGKPAYICGGALAESLGIPITPEVKDFDYFIQQAKESEKNGVNNS